MTITNTFANLAGSLDVFAPKPQTHAPAPAPTATQIERVAEQEGFRINNNPVVRRTLKSGRVASKDKAQPMTLRIRVADWNKFSSFCVRNDYTVAEGFERLASLAEGL
jgi:hypothetical protein